MAITTLLGGCTMVGPNYRVPDAAMIRAPVAQGGFVAGTSVTVAEPLPDHWWKLYNDPILDRLIGEALAANTDLRAAQANLQRSLALLGLREVNREIQSAFSAETSYAQRSAEAELQHVQPPVHGIYNIGIAVSYDLDLFGGLKRGIEAASADADAAIAARDLVRVNVAAETARAYADLCNSGFQTDVLNRSLAWQEKGLRLTGILVRYGRLAPYELDRRQALLDAGKSRLPRLAARQRNALLRITALAGRVPAEADSSLLACQHPLDLAQPIPVGDGQALLKRRPDIRMAERHLAASTARIGVATAALYPDIKLGATIGSTGVGSDLFSPLTNRYGVGPQISWAINRHAVRAQIRAADAQSQADLAAFDGAVIKALREVETALNTYAADMDRHRTLQRSCDETERVAQRIQQLRHGGRIAELPTVEANRDLTLAEQALAESEAALNEDQMMLFLSLGGGWSA